MKNQQKAYLFALTAVLFWSTMATAFTLALRELDILQLLFGATFVSFICVLIIVGFRRKLKFIGNLKNKEIFHSALLGLFNPFLYYVVLFKAYSILPAQEAMALNYVWPITLVLLSIPVLKQRISLWGGIAILVSFAGVLIIATKGDLISFRFTNLYGDILALGSSIAWSLFFIFNTRDKRDEAEKLLLNFFFSLVYITIAILLFSEFRLPTVRGVIACTYIGLFEMGITFIIWLKALRYSETTDKVSQLIFLSPFLALIWIFLVIGEPILLSTIIGLAFIISGIFLQQRFGRKR